MNSNSLKKGIFLFCSEAMVKIYLNRFHATFVFSGNLFMLQRYLKS